MVKGALSHFLENGRITKGVLVEFSGIKYYKHRNRKALFVKGAICKNTLKCKTIKEAFYVVHANKIVSIEVGGR